MKFIVELEGFNMPNRIYLDEQLEVDIVGFGSRALGLLAPSSSFQIDTLKIQQNAIVRLSFRSSRIWRPSPRMEKLEGKNTMATRTSNDSYAAAVL
jgi:hypothetical protein